MSANGDEVTPRTSVTMAEQQLEQLIARKDRLLQKVATPSTRYTIDDLVNNYESLIRDFETFIHTYPHYIYGYLVFAKFLRETGRIEDANRIYVKANAIKPTVPLIKQQIGNYLAEVGESALAVAYYLSAIELMPSNATYHYQLGEVLATYADFLLADGVYTRVTLDSAITHAFSKAAELAPQNMSFQFRYAESFFDLAKPNWKSALTAWQELAARNLTADERNLVHLQMARIYLQLGNNTLATRELNRIYFSPKYEPIRCQLLLVAQKKHLVGTFFALPNTVFGRSISSPLATVSR